MKIELEDIKGHVLRMIETQLEYKMDNDWKDINCIFVGNDDGTYSPSCEPGIVIPNAVVAKWLEESDRCPFCGLLSGSIR